MADETPRDGSAAISLAEVSAAVAQFRSRFPPDEQLDQRMRLLLHLFARVVEHAGFGAAAVLTDQHGLDAFAYEVWAAHKGKNPDGQMNRPRRETIQRLCAYWGRELAAGRSGATRTPLARDEHFTFVRQRSSFEITERTKNPFERVPLRLYVRWTPPAVRSAKRRKTEEPEEERWLAVGAERADRPPAERVEDPRIILPPGSPELLLEEAARTLVSAFQAVQRPSFQHVERGIRVDVAPQRKRATRLGWSLLGMLVLAGCGVVYDRGVAADTRVYYRLLTMLGANAYCDGPRRDDPAIVVNWRAAAPDGWFTRMYVLRNGKRLARVDGLDEYRDRSVEPSRTYTYGFELRDLFGRLLQRDDTASSDTARPCPDGVQPSSTPISVTPTEGTFETPFTFTIRTPAVDGQPLRYAWAWKATRLDAAKRIVAPPPRITREPSTVIVFDPCTCGPAGTTAAGTRRWICRVRTTVTFAAGDAIEYGSPEVVILDPSGRDCRSHEDVARSDAVP